MRASKIISMVGFAAIVVGSTPVTAQEAAPQGPVEFTGRIACGPPVSVERSGTETTLDVGEGGSLTRYRNGAWHQTATVSDPRLDGDWYHTWENDAYVMPGSKVGPNVASATWRIENDQGAWQGGHIEASLVDGTPIASGPTLLVGEGGYEGLSAIVQVTGFEDGCAADIRGVIFDDIPVGVPYDPE